jgi:beta-aspartyl-peptidase (threonine type)
MSKSSLRTLGVRAAYAAALVIAAILWLSTGIPTAAEQQPMTGRVLQPEMDRSTLAIQQAIHSVLDAQIKAWNAGDVETFMETYWKSDEVTFSSGGKMTRSWKATLDRYKERYPTRAAMGTTTFKNLEITPLCDSAAMVLGEWQLRRESGETIGGNFTLVLRQIEGKWLIIHDHTSQAPTARE